MIYKYKVGDKVRITNPDEDFFSDYEMDEEDLHMDIKYVISDLAPITTTTGITKPAYRLRASDFHVYESEISSCEPKDIVELLMEVL